MYKQLLLSTLKIFAWTNLISLSNEAPRLHCDRVSVDPCVINKRVLGLTGPDVEHTGRQLPLQSEELSAGAVETDRDTVVPGCSPSCALVTENPVMKRKGVEMLMAGKDQRITSRLELVAYYT